MAASSALSRSLEQEKAAPKMLHQIDPLSDRRWDDLVASHPRASAFHRRGWLEALALTYGYKPLALTSTPANQPLSDGVVFCEVRSWITGNRLVSLPFSDHCEPLLNETGDFSEFARWIPGEYDRRRWKYVELRPLSWSDLSDRSLQASESYWFHTLDLSPSIEQLFQHLHKNTIQRSIRRAEREQLSYESGRSEQLLNDFYGLLLITRRRHRLPPQPRTWFRNLLSCLDSSVTLRLARKDGISIAALLTLRHRNRVIYKYGCSDEKFHSLAGMPFLFWKLIEESKATGAEQIDFGRTDLDNEGLTTFKNRFGTGRRRLTYFRYPAAAEQKSINLSSVRSIFSVLPDLISSGVGRMIYRHLG